MGKVVIPGFRKIETSSSGEGGTTNYNDLTNKPSINNVPLVGNLRTVDLKLTDATLTEEGVPAEAKAVGAKLEEQSTSLTAVKEELTKKVNVSDIPTKVSELQNDSNYQTDTDVTNTLTTYATKTYVGEQISSVDHLKREIVTEIPSPETADKNTIYMLKIESATGEDKYKEYLLIDGTLQCIGDTSVDLTDYAKKTEIPTELPANGGNSLTVNGHTVKSDVPENAVFTDTVYDDTEVKESIDELNSNLDTLEFSDTAGGKNIIGCTNVIESSYGTLTKTESGYSVTGVYYGILEFKCEKNTDYFISYEKSGSGTNLVKAINSSRNADIAEFNTNGGTFNSGDNETVYLYLYGGYGTSNTSIYNNFLLCKGTSGTYEPYIPSVKMLAEEVSAQNESLSNKTKLTLELGDIKWIDGSNIESTTWKRSGFIKVTPNTKYTLNRTQTEHMNIIGYKEDKTVITDGTTVTEETSAIIKGCNTVEFEFTTTPTTNYIRLAITDTNLSENITLTNNGIGNTVVELVEDVSALKNDLGGLSFSVSGTTLSITDGTNTWTLEAN